MRGLLVAVLTPGLVHGVFVAIKNPQGKPLGVCAPLRASA